MLPLFWSGIWDCLGLVTFASGTLRRRKWGGERIWSGAVGWSKLGEAIYSELDVSMPLPPPGL